MSLETVAQRYAFDRPGYSLIDFIEVGLPVYKLAVIASFLERKSIPVIHEFVLRAIASGLNIDKDVAGFLGIESSYVEDALAELDAAELVAVTPTPDGRKLSLSTRGQQCAIAAEAIAPVTSEIALYFDGIVRKLMTPTNEAYWKYQQIQAAGIKEMSSRPPRRPQLAEINIADARDFSSRLSDLRGKTKRELLALRAIENSQRFFQVAQLLVYRSTDTGEVDFSVIVDSKSSESHRAVLLKGGGLSRLGIESPTEVPKLDIVGQFTTAQVVELEEGTAQAASVLESALDAVNVLTSGDDSEEAKVGAAGEEGTLAALERAAIEVRSIPIRYLEVFEHPGYLEDALVNARDRLMIIAPWIKQAVLDRNRMKHILNLIESSCKVYIGWGIGKGDRAFANDISVVHRLQELHDQYPNMFFVDLGNTHEKVLIKDRDYVITTSFNWLSFKGDPNRTLRYERGVHVSHPHIVDQEFEKLVARFEDSKETKASGEQLTALAAKFAKA